MIVILGSFLPTTKAESIVFFLLASIRLYNSWGVDSKSKTKHIELKSFLNFLDIRLLNVHLRVSKSLLMKSL